MPDFQPVTKATPSRPFMRAVTLRTPKCPCEPMRVRREVQIVANTTFTHLGKAAKAVRANQFSLESKLTFRGLFSLRCGPPSQGPGGQSGRYSSRGCHLYCGMYSSFPKKFHFLRKILKKNGKAAHLRRGGGCFLCIQKSPERPADCWP